MCFIGSPYFICVCLFERQSLLNDVISDSKCQIIVLKNLFSNPFPVKKIFLKVNFTWSIAKAFLIECKIVTKKIFSLYYLVQNFHFR